MDVSLYWNDSSLFFQSVFLSSHLRELSACQQQCTLPIQYPSSGLVTSEPQLRLLTSGLLPPATISRRCFSTTKPQYFLFKPSDPNIDPESKQPLTHPEKGVMVYSGPLTRALKKLKRISFFTSFMGFSLIPYFIVNHLAWPVVIAFTAFGFATPCLIHFIFGKNYVTDIYFNDKTKVFHLAKVSFWLHRVEVKFTADDVVVPDVAGPYSTYMVKGVPVFINRTLFISKDVYKHMVGYDKPLIMDIDQSVDLNQSAGPVNLDADAVDTDEIKELEKKIKSKSEA